MALDRDELAARCLAALLSRDGYDVDGDAVKAVQAADALRAALVAVNPEAVAPAPVVDAPTIRSDVEATFPLGSKVRVVRQTPSPAQRERFPVDSIETVRGYDHYDGRWRLLVADNKGWVLPCECVEAVPAAPASVPTPAIDPRRTVGAVVRGPTFDTEFVVIGPDGRCCRVEQDDGGVVASVLPSDTFVRWATREECEKHGIPYVDRTAPASKPVDRSVDREGLADAIRRSRAGGFTMTEWSRLDVYDRERFLAYADAAIAYMKGGA